MKLYLLIPVLIFLFFVGCLYIQFNPPKNLNKIIDETATSLNQKLSDKLDFSNISFKWNFEPIEKDKWSQTPIRRTDFSIKSFNSLGN